MSTCLVELNYIPKFDQSKIAAIPFANKLWIVAHLRHRNFIQWSYTGDSILIHLSDLDTYLHSLQSMFKAKDCNQFLLNLHEHGFKLIRQDEVELLEFSHKYFTRDRVEYLCMIVNESKNFEPEKKTRQRSQYDVGFRMPLDYCVMKIARWTELQFYQAKTKIAMEYNAADYALKTALEKRTTFGAPLPSKIFLRPAESILEVKRDQNYIGYHGEALKEQLEEFFGDHKPILHAPKEEIPRTFEPVEEDKFFNLDFLKPEPAEPQVSNMFALEYNEIQNAKLENPAYPALNDIALETYSNNSDFLDEKTEPREDDDDDEIFEDDDEDIEPIEETDEMEQNPYSEHDKSEQYEQSWSNSNEPIETQSQWQLFDSLPDLNSFFQEEGEQNQTGVPFPSQSRYYSDR